MIYAPAFDGQQVSWPSPRHHRAARSFNINVLELESLYRDPPELMRIGANALDKGDPAFSMYGVQPLGEHALVGELTAAADKDALFLALWWFCIARACYFLGPF
jgi:hypothetical protein